jgi:hypothetical protein
MNDNWWELGIQEVECRIDAEIASAYKAGLAMTFFSSERSLAALGMTRGKRYRSDEMTLNEIDDLRLRSLRLRSLSFDFTQDKLFRSGQAPR